MAFHQRTVHANRLSQILRQLVQPAPLVCLLLILVQAPVFLLNFGPLSMPDPDMHAGGAYALATDQSLNPLTYATDSDGNRHGELTFTAPDGMFGEDSRFVNGVVTNLLFSNGPVGVDVQRDAQREALASGTALVETTVRANQYMPLVYLPQAVGMRVALWAGQGSWGMLKAGRLMNLLTFLTLSVTAVALAGRARCLLAVIAVNPIAVFCASSLMCDGLLIGLALLAIGLWCAVMDGRVHAGWPLLVGLVVVALLLGGKFVYLPVLLPFLALPSRMVSVKRKIIGATIVLIPALTLSLLWSRLHGYVHHAPGVNIPANKQWLLQHPVRAFEILLANVFEFLMREPVSSMWGVLAPILICVIVMYARRLAKTTPTSWMRWLATHQFALLAVASIMLMLGMCYGSLLLTWVPTNSIGIEIPALAGFQERYLWPMLPLLALPLYDETSKD